LDGDRSAGKEEGVGGQTAQSASHENKRKTEFSRVEEPVSTSDMASVLTKGIQLKCKCGEL